MFPYSAPASHREVSAFMRAHGAGTSTSVPRNKNTWQQQRLNHADSNKPASIVYHITRHMAFGDFFTYNLPPDNLPAAVHSPHTARTPGWYHALVSDARAFLANDPRGFQPRYDTDNGPARLVDKLGDLLRKHGYSRDLTALTIAFYRYNAGNFDSYTAGELFVPKFLDIAHLAALTDLTDTQKIDVLARQISRHALDDLIASGAPYGLARDMYPMTGTDGWQRLLS